MAVSLKENLLHVFYRGICVCTSENKACLKHEHFHGPISHNNNNRMCITLNLCLLFPSEQLLYTDSMYGRLVLLNTPLYSKCKQYYFPCPYALLNYDFLFPLLFTRSCVWLLYLLNYVSIQQFLCDNASVKVVSRSQC